MDDDDDIQRYSQDDDGVAADPAAEQAASNLGASGRNTLFCCLSCGIPFSFPDDAYTSADRDVQARQPSLIQEMLALCLSAPKKT
jgi:hypothetical protein